MIHVNGVPTLPSILKEDSDAQSRLFEIVAGRYMGSDHRRGHTYSWLINHLMDANQEVSPRSFLGALQIAASALPAPARLVVDPAGIRAGVQGASRVRVDQLKEDHQWIGLALGPLAEQRVPCDARDFIARWRDAATIAHIREDIQRQSYLGPIELEDRKSAPEEALIDSLIRLGILERRQDGRINMPDIYRVAAKIYRKGGVPVRSR